MGRRYDLLLLLGFKHDTNDLVEMTITAQIKSMIIVNHI